MKYWYFKFTYENATTRQGIKFDRVIQSDGEHFPLKEVRIMAQGIIQETPGVSFRTDLANDDFSIMIDNQFQISKEDFDHFNENLKK